MPGYIKRGGGVGLEPQAWHKLYDLHVQVGSAWHRVDRAYVKADDGNWHPFFQYVANVTTAVDITSSTGLTITDAPNEAYTVSGVMRSADTGSPLPGGLTVKLQQNSTTVYATTTTATDGSFTLSWKPTKTGDYTPYVAFDEQAQFQASSKGEGTLQVASQMTVTTTWPTRLIIGQSTTFTGAVKTATGEYPSGATVALMRTLNGASYSMNTGTVSSTGTFSIPWVPNAASHTVSGAAYYFKISPSDTPRFPTTWGASQVIPGYQPTPSAVKQTVTAITNTSVKIKVDDQANVLYFICRCAETGNTVRLNSTGTAGADLVAFWEIGQDATYHFTTTAYSDNPTDNSTVSNTITVTTGHAATTDRGSAVFTFYPVKTGSWRSPDAWANLGTKLGQGYYSNGHPYFGVATFNTQAMAATIDAYGTDRAGRWAHLSVSKTEVYLDRVSGSGSGADVPVNMYLTSSSVGQTGQPVILGSMQRITPGLGYGEHAWFTAPTSANTWLGSMLNNDFGVCMYANNSSQYSVYNGGSSFALRVTCSWNWTPVPYKAPTYSG